MIIQLSPQVHLYPQGSSPPALPAGHLALPHRPDHAFGDGSHPTTRLCAGAVDQLCRLYRPARVLDVGTGTGVLARIARQRGAQQIMATDIDPVALASATAHVQMDVARARPASAAGQPSPVPILVSDKMPDAWGPLFDLVVANILEGPLRELQPALVRALAPGGHLLLSGFTPLQVPGLRLKFTSDTGLTYVLDAELERWSLLCFKKASDRTA